MMVFNHLAVPNCDRSDTCRVDDDSSWAECSKSTEVVGNLIIFTFISFDSTRFAWGRQTFTDVVMTSHMDEYIKMRCTAKNAMLNFTDPLPVLEGYTATHRTLLKTARVRQVS
jgi:hypothetical protein